MDIINLNQVEPFITKDGSKIRELLSPRNSVITRQSLAEARLKPGQCTQLHYHSNTEEIYFILTGVGEMKVNHEIREVKRFDTIAIPPGAQHQIKNIGEDILILLCCCVPAYTHEDTVLV